MTYMGRGSAVIDVFPPIGTYRIDVDGVLWMLSSSDGVLPCVVEVAS